jgi:hypothetical protein
MRSALSANAVSDCQATMFAKAALQPNVRTHTPTRRLSFMDGLSITMAQVRGFRNGTLPPRSAHNPEAAAYGHYIVQMRDGRIIERPS